MVLLARIASLLEYERKLRNSNINRDMKKVYKLKTSFDYSPIALRALVRHKIAPPTKYFTDKKKHASKSACRLEVKHFDASDKS